MTLLPPRGDPRRTRVLVVFGVVLAIGALMTLLGIAGGLFFERVYLRP